MQENFNIPDELKGIAPTLLTLGNTNPYTVPTAYFDSLSSQIIALIKLDGISHEKTPYSAPPPTYFDAFADVILTKIKAEVSNTSEVMQELEEIAPLLTTINKANVYSVPPDYFDSVQLMPPSHQTGKVISLKDNIRQFLHYAVAACVLFIIATSSFVYVRAHTKNANKRFSIEQRLANLNEDDIVNYLKYDHQAEDLTPATNLQENQFKNLLMNASDEEIEYFLDEGNDNDEKPVNGI